MWIVQLSQFFVNTKRTLAITAILPNLNPLAKPGRTVDGPYTAISAVLEQWCGRGWQPMAFMSMKHTEADKNYSTFDKELLAAPSDLRKFSHYLERRPFIICTDHNPFAMTSSANYPPWQRRHLFVLV